jgi:hypothetical protein
MKLNNKTASAKNNAELNSLKPVFLDEIPALPEKFYTFTHEGISMIWLDETATNPIRGNHSNQ